MDTRGQDAFKPILYLRRWFVLTAYCLLTVSNLSAWFAFPAISNIIQRYYNIDLIQVNWLAITYYALAACLMFAAHHFLKVKGLKFTIVMSGFFNALGCCVRYTGYFTTNGYWFLFTGSILCGISTSFFLFLPSNIAAVWFGENERATATSIAIAADSLGIALSYFLSTSIVENKPSLQQIGNELGIFLLIEALQGLFAFIFICFAVQDQPKTPPSYSEALKRNEANSLLDSSEDDSKDESTPLLTEAKKRKTNQISEFRLLAKNLHFIIVVIMAGITFGLDSTFLVTLNEILIPKFPGYEKQVGLVGSLGLIVSIITCFFVGMLLDRTRAFKRITMITTGLSTLLLGSFAMCYRYNASFYVLFMNYLALIAVSTTYYTTSFDHSAELTYPISEARSGVVLIWVGQIFGLTFGELATTVLNAIGPQLLLFAMFGVNLFSFVLSLFLKDKGTRPTLCDNVELEKRTL